MKNQKLKLEKEFFEKELCEHKQSLGSLGTLLKKNEAGRTTTMTSLKERETEIEELKKKIREIVVRSEEELRTERRKGEEDRRGFKKGHEELQGSYFKLFEQHSEVYGKLKGLEKQHECSLLRLNDEKKVLRTKKDDFEAQLQNKGWGFGCSIHSVVVIRIV